jgi:hypothetical protein
MTARDSKHGNDSPLLVFSGREWGNFLAGVKKGEFDLT